ncbi:MAG: glycosyltransferase family 4 protein [Phycisphaerae bacterium]|nr:glycosyltransferase family 4 protein [Gemmatimonadaceae bacterium]
MLQTLWVGAATFLVALVLTWQFRRYALAKGLLDVPNARSSHDLPTPRGGGVAIVIAVLVAAIALTVMHAISPQVAAALITSGGIAAAIGYADDRKQVSLRLRLVAQFLAAGCVLWFLGLGPVTRALGLPESAAMFVAPFALLQVVWMLNLTNFMDGIDGIASTEVITVCIGIAVCALGLASEAVTASHQELLACVTIIACASAGFLCWNWSPAKIFMGDAGSGFLGVMLGALSLLAAAVHPALLWSAVILNGVFIVDATVTLFRRIARRETFYHAHRSHAYQHAARRWNHQRVTIAVALVNMCWLLPFALLAALDVLHGGVAVTLAYIPLLALAFRLKAGLPE